MKQFLTLLVSIAILSSCAEQEQKEAPMTENILLKEWKGPYGGVPAFDKMNVADIKEAIIKGMEMNLEEIDAIANNPEPATFENTIDFLIQGINQYGIHSNYYI